jgi:hypothetical protein
LGQPESKRVVAEKDPLTSFGMTAATSAEEARVAGDWKKALALARESLSFSPDQTIARFVVSAFRRKVVREALVAGAYWVVLCRRSVMRSGCCSLSKGSTNPAPF